MLKRTVWTTDFTDDVDGKELPASTTDGFWVSIPRTPFGVIEKGMCCPRTTLNTRNENNVWKSPRPEDSPFFGEAVRRV